MVWLTRTWRRRDTALRCCFLHVPELLAALAYMSGWWAGTTVVVMLHGGWIAVAAFVAPPVLYHWLSRRYRRPPVRPRAAHQPPPPPPEPPPTVAPAPAAVFPLLGLRAPFSRTEVSAAFRRQAQRCHPDHGGSAVLFRALVAERQNALALAR